MENRFISVFRKALWLANLALLLAVATAAHATTHIIQFGGSLGIVYSPKSLSISVGDTITWQGDFTMHPLSSTSVPAGAASFHQGSGSSFSYIVSVAGTYMYQCDIHFSLGMTGSFTAVATGVENAWNSSQPDDFKLEQNYPNPFNPTTAIQFSVAKLSIVDLKIFDLGGREVETLVDGPMEAGAHQVTFDASRFASGIYFYRLQAGSFTATKKFVLLK